MPGTDERDLGVAILLLMAKGNGYLEIASPEYFPGQPHEGQFAVSTDLESGDTITGHGDTLTEAAENCVRELPPEIL